MALADSNTYTEVTAGTALATARLRQNETYHSLLVNFASNAAPSLTAANYTRDGTAIAVPTGALFYHDNSGATGAGETSALYIQDSDRSRVGSGHPLTGTGFTRQGIVRTEDSIAQLISNAHTYEPGEVVSVISGSTSHLKLTISSASGIDRFVDCRIPPLTGNIVNTMISLGTVSGVTSDRMNVASEFNSGGFTGANITFAVQSFHNHGGSGASATRGANVAIGFNSQNSAANASLVFYGAGTGATVGTKSGLRVHGHNGANLAPLAANVIMQSVIGNGVGANDVAPIVPVGTVSLWSGATAPTGFLLCDGSAISRTTYAGLFALIGTTYGAGDTTTTFAVPDLRDRLPLGKGTNNSTLGAVTTGASGSSIVATAAATQSITTTTGTFSTSAKDSSTGSAITGVTTSSHTHNVTLPTQVMNYIIKT
tara:strand:- start:1632 stop:2912 length:1281 start_codon:yes stop_codon:yes gene_type:complete